MHRKVLLLSIFILYFSLATFGLLVFDAGSLISALVLFGFPAMLLARFASAPQAVLITVATFGAGLSILLEGIAHTYGIWYSLGVDELRLFGLVPIEVIIGSVIQTLFLVLLYELLFDDGTYSDAHARNRFLTFGVFAVGVLLLVAIHQYVLQGIFFTHSYIWILGILIASAIASLSVTKTLTLRFFDRLVAFMLYSALPLLLSLFVSVANTHKIFAHQNDYLYTITLFQEMVPLEELLLILALPLFVATVYELYLDDRV
jgi:hypothetical protein